MHNSLSLTENTESIKKAKESAGKSGSFFIFSFDGRFILKTLKKSELKTLLQMLENYYGYISSEN